ncbi:MAG: glycosyltransferase family 9 protein [bacterium]
MSKQKIYFVLHDVYFWFLRLIFFWILTKKSKNKKLLIIRTDHIGDFIIFSPAIKYIKSIYPDYEIYFLGNRILAEIINWFPQIDQFIPLDIKKFQFNPFYYLQIFYRLRKEFFDIVLCPVYSRSFTVDELVRISNAKKKIGFSGDNNNIDLEKKIKDDKFYTNLIKSSSQVLSEIERNKIFVESLGLKLNNDLFPKIEIQPIWREKAIKLLRENDWKGLKYAVVNPGAGSPCRIWPVEKFGKITNFLLEKGFVVVFTGGPNEEYLFDDIYQYVDKKVNNNVLTLINKTSFEELSAILSDAIFYFGAECGVLHLALAVGCPTIGILGGGHFGRFFPYGDLNKNRIVYDKNMKCQNDNWQCARPHPDKPAPCIENIQIADAIKEINFLLDSFKQK